MSVGGYLVDYFVQIDLNPIEVKSMPSNNAKDKNEEVYSPSLKKKPNINTPYFHPNESFSKKNTGNLIESIAKLNPDFFIGKLILDANRTEKILGYFIGVMTIMVLIGSEFAYNDSIIAVVPSGGCVLFFVSGILNIFFGWLAWFNSSPMFAYATVLNLLFFCIAIIIIRFLKIFLR